jgi:hypothetical protein
VHGIRLRPSVLDVPSCVPVGRHPPGAFEDNGFVGCAAVADADPLGARSVRPPPPVEIEACHEIVARGGIEDFLAVLIHAVQRQSVRRSRG